MAILSLTSLAPTSVLAQQEPKAEDTLRGVPQTDEEQLTGQRKDDQPTKAASANVGKEMHNPLANLKEVFFQTDILPNVGPHENTFLTTPFPGPQLDLEGAMVGSNAKPLTSNELQREVIAINRQNANKIAQPRNLSLVNTRRPVKSRTYIPLEFRA